MTSSGGGSLQEESLFELMTFFKVILKVILRVIGPWKQEGIYLVTMDE